MAVKNTAGNDGISYEVIDNATSFAYTTLAPRANAIQIVAGAAGEIVIKNTSGTTMTIYGLLGQIIPVRFTEITSATGATNIAILA